ncbi:MULTISPECIES: hypothetical protein [unclassified Exiguobacterium]|uniref:hypothetical protein n=1 Tax=unclassified Exiguobacterium TaxID=2644629 RepID=UPI001040A5A2|nr:MULTISPECIES: hypothetical protein [unclassified Exiguobacterium]TCI26467.1 hypothetical protein EVJ32_06180 [Exiguobacterium sp. SH5S4]TCI37666.1 hypothetical protein EVJ29_06475 [Exiguobacterium sp. SH4S7]TCI46000.1 hypothetical protein EVJ31_07515 [Exiguobacterium sp. SH5S32]TCI51757.1 hypothetical protein EVJ25_09765 [Exiguobacterium sp. SH1S4]TCI53605.1 hypothetical protein EVJ30_07700 [Exiguobacterium sp. SH5S13]
MDYMWLLIAFFLFMLVILTVFISSVLNALLRNLHPLVHITVILFLSFTYERLMLDYNLLWTLFILVTISYLAPLLVVKMYNKGERFEREHLK